ncbi:MAG: hypothetical protein GXZ19_00015 [Bacteroidales bacterium]|nr:hypothetical protein [Bacteroidales bacterium]
MSQTCPLCGKTKSEETLFCADCAKKIHVEYEVDIPKEISKENLPSSEEAIDYPLIHKDKGNREDELKSVLIPEPALELEIEPETKPEILYPKKKKKIGTPLLYLLVVALCTATFFLYNATIRKKNLDRSAWSATVKTNSVEGYLIYMETHPQGAYFDEAQAGLLRLKSEEAAEWERLKMAANPAELRDFLYQHPESPYTRLVNRRLDSLVWVRAAQTNTADAYSDYIKQAENGGVIGDYIAEAEKRYEELLMPPPDEILESDSLARTKP